MLEGPEDKTSDEEQVAALERGQEEEPGAETVAASEDPPKKNAEEKAQSEVIEFHDATRSSVLLRGIVAIVAKKSVCVWG